MTSEDQSQALQQYTNSTNGILGYLKNQLTTIGLWTNTPGTFSKVVSSSGYSWGLSKDGKTLAWCREPCNGTWTPLRGLTSTFIDIAADTTSVYVLYSGKFITLSGDPTSQTPLNPQTVPFNANSISVTNGYVWVSGDSQMAFCAKPCSTASWNVKKDAHRLLSAGASSVYAVDPGTSSLVKTDETAQTGWAPVSGFSDILPVTVGAEADNTAIYGSDGKNTYRCDGTCTSKDQLEKIDTQGYIPISEKGSISVNPITKNVWVATSSSGTGGNLFQRLDTPNTDPILNYIEENQNQRDRIFNSLGDATKIQTYKTASDMAKRESNQAIKQAVDMSEKVNDMNSKVSLLQRKVETTKQVTNNINANIAPLKILLGTLAIVLAVYVLAGWLIPQSMLMWVSVVILSVGFGTAIYFSTST